MGEKLSVYVAGYVAIVEAIRGETSFSRDLRTYVVRTYGGPTRCSARISLFWSIWCRGRRPEIAYSDVQRL